MKFHPLMQGLYVLAGLAALSTMARAEDVNLRYKYKEGEKLNYDLTQNMTLEMTVAGRDVTVKLEQKVRFAWAIKEVDKDGKAKMTQTITRCRIKMEAPGSKIDYDSKDDKEPDGDLAKQVVGFYKSLLGEDIQLTMDSRGQVGNLKVSDKLIEAIKKSKIAASLGDFGSEEGIKKLMSQGGLVLPEKPIAVGKSWNNKVEIQIKNSGKTVTDVKLTYDGQETSGGKTLEKISEKPTVSIVPDDGATLVVKMKSQEGKGTAYFDNKAGRLIENSLTQELNQEITAAGQTVAQKIKQTVTFKLADSKE